MFLAVLELESPYSRHEQIIFSDECSFLASRLPFLCIFLQMGEMGEFSRIRITRQSETEHNGPSGQSGLPIGESLFLRLQCLDHKSRI